MELRLIIKAGSPPRHTLPRRITLDRCQNSRWSISERASLGKKDISPVAMLNTFLVIAELFRYAVEFQKFLALGTIIFFVGYFITFLGDWILI